MEYAKDYPAIEDWVSLNLYDAATAIRMSHSGGGEPLDPDDEVKIRKRLVERVGAGWRKSNNPIVARADNAVRKFVWSALSETATHHIAPANWHTLCGIDANTAGLVAYDECDNSPGLCEECVWKSNGGRV